MARMLETSVLFDWNRKQAFVLPGHVFDWQTAIKNLCELAAFV
jgi:hypothetical protein